MPEKEAEEEAMKPAKTVQKLAQKLYDIGVGARYRFDEREGRWPWGRLREAQQMAWFAIAEYVIRLIGSEEKGK
jgi:hypothetical protein